LKGEERGVSAEAGPGRKYGFFKLRISLYYSCDSSLETNYSMRDLSVLSFLPVAQRRVPTGSRP
jgi:hypothetical protein